MLKYIIFEELRFRLKQPMFYAFGMILFLVVMAPLATDSIDAFSQLGNIVRNSPFVIAERMIFANILAIIFMVIIIGSSIVRDYENGFSELIFTTPIKKLPYLMGRFLGSFLALMLLFLMASIGVEVAALIRGEELTGPIRIYSHLYVFAVFIVPNTLFAGGIFFMMATLSKKIMTAYIGLFGLVIFYAITNILISTQSNSEGQQLLLAILDPFALSVLYSTTEFWSIAEKSTLFIPLSKPILLNRMLWSGIGFMSLFTTFYFFSFDLKQKKGKTKRSHDATKKSIMGEPLIIIKPLFDLKTFMVQLTTMVKMETAMIFKNRSLWIITLLGMLNLFTALSAGMDSNFGSSVYPYTSLITNVLDINLFVGVFLIIAFFTAESVWRERQYKFDILVDSLPTKNWMPLISKMFSMVSVLVTYLSIVFVICVTFQISSGFTQLELGLLLKTMFVKHFLLYLPWIVIGFAIQVIATNKYSGLFGMLLFLIVMQYTSMNTSNFLITYTLLLATPFTDMAGFAHFLQRLVSLEMYWLSWAILLSLITYYLWRRGANTRLIDRIKMIRFSKHSFAAIIVVFVLIISSGYNVYYQSEVLGKSMSSDEMDLHKAQYEMNYGLERNLTQPIITEVFLEADFYPSKIELEIRGHYVLVNKTDKIINKLNVNLSQMSIEYLYVDNAKMTHEDNEFGFYTFIFDHPLLPGDTTQLNFDVKYDQKGFKIRGNNLNMLTNGMMFNNTFFNTGKYVPYIGYNEFMQLSNPKKRKENGLSVIDFQEVIDLHANPSKNLLNTGADWINFEAIISTENNQVIAGTGKQVDSWTENDRNYYRYISEQPMQNIFVFSSGKYTVKKVTHNGVDIEVYHHPTHNINIDFLVNVTKNTLDYASEAFGSYPYSQMRIVEIPDYYTQGQSYPNILTLTSDFGFMSDYSKGNADKPNSLAWVISHEIAHQWWLNQVVPAKVPGATIMSEALCEYTSMMTAKKMFGETYVNKMVKQRTNEYLKGRGYERNLELPLADNVEQLGTSQMYIAYQKASVVMHSLAKLVGEDSVNIALKRFFNHYQFQNKYPLPKDLLTYYNEVTPDTLLPVIDKMFNSISFFEHSIQNAQIVEDNGIFRVEAEIKTEFFLVNDEGTEVRTPMYYPLDLALYDSKDQLIDTITINSDTKIVSITLDQKPKYMVLDPEHIYIEKKRLDNKIDL